MIVSSPMLRILVAAVACAVTVFAALLVSPRTAAAATMRLTPNGDVANTWQVTPAGAAWAALDDPISQPDPVPATDRIWASAAGRVAHLGMSTAALNGGYAHSGTLWYYANTGATTRLQVEVIWQGAVRGSITVPAGQGFAWRQLTIPTARQAALDDLRVRLTSLDGGDTNVRALYATVETAAFRTVVDWESAANRDIIQTETTDWNRQWCTTCPHAASIASTPVRAGSYSARFELRQGDKAPNNLGSRTEVTTAEPDAGIVERWYGFSIYLDATWPQQDTLGDILTQWHHAADQGSPPLSVGTRDGRWQVALFGNPLASPTLQDSTYVRGAWTDWVVHVKWSSSETGPTAGFFELWLNGQPVMLTRPGTPQPFHRFTGKTNYDNNGVYTKFGIYKWGWNSLSPNPNNRRIIFYDDLRIADQTGDYTAVAP